MKTPNFYNVKFVLANDVTTGGKRYQAEFPMSVNIFATSKKRAIKKALATLPHGLDSAVIKTSIKCRFEMDGNSNRQLQNLFKGFTH